MSTGGPAPSYPMNGPDRSHDPGIDLHVHTNASDGERPPAEIVRQAIDLGLRAIAITDHDTTDGVQEALNAAEGSQLLVIPGVEISSDARGEEIHVLGYFIDHNHPGFSDQLARFRASRLRRAKRMVSKLSGMGMPLDWDQVRRRAAGDSIGRPHIAQAMLDNGYVSSIEDAFRSYIGRNGPAFVDRLKLSPEAAIHLIAEAGGLAVLAHPLWATHRVAVLARCGLAGLEAYYTGYSEEETSLLVDLARQHGLLVTGGSDFHGSRVQPGHELGSVRVPNNVIQELQAYHERLLPGRGSTGASI